MWRWVRLTNKARPPKGKQPKNFSSRTIKKMKRKGKKGGFFRSSVEWVVYILVRFVMDILTKKAFASRKKKKMKNFEIH